MMGRPAGPPWVLILALSVAGLIVGALSLSFARGEPAYAFAGDSIARAVIETGAGYGLIAAGLASWARRPESRFGVLLALAGIGWLLTEWNNPGLGSSLAFTMGLALYAVAPPLVAHAALAYPGGRVSSLPARVGVLFAYLGAVVMLGLLPALLFDPAGAGCAGCPENLLLVHRDSGSFDDINRFGVELGVVWALTLLALLALRFVRSTSALRRLIWPVLAAAGVYLGLVVAHLAHGLDRGFIGNDPTDADLRLAQGAALLALALGVAWGWFRARQTRGDVARLVVELARSPAPGGLRDALAEKLGDPSLEIAYPLGEGRLVDAAGRTVALAGDVTAFVREGREVARLSHRPGLLDDPGLVEEVATAARLALENERLRAEAGAQLEDLRASRARVIAAGDAERRRLERDLHDGAQQKLVGLALSLRLAQSRLGPNLDSSVLATIGAAQAELHSAIAELRELAQGIFPAVLADEGLAAALEALMEGAHRPIEITRLPDGRFDPTVEAAAFFVVSETLRRSDAGRVQIAGWRDHGRLVIEILADDRPKELIELEDRVGALDGTLAVAGGPGGVVRVRAEIPCE
jgi:signal transduction histidine kinase